MALRLRQRAGTVDQRTAAAASPEFGIGVDEADPGREVGLIDLVPLRQRAEGGQGLTLHAQQQPGARPVEGSQPVPLQQPAQVRRRPPFGLTQAGADGGLLVRGQGVIIQYFHMLSH